MLKDVKIPEISDNVTSGKVVAVLVKAGDSVAVDDVLVELETDKAVVEIPSPYAGKIDDILVAEGDEKNIGEIIVRIEIETSQDEPDNNVLERPATAEQAAVPEITAAVNTPVATEPPQADGSDSPPQAAPLAAAVAVVTSPPSERPSAPAAPSVRRFARELGVDIHAVPGTGPGGRISETDVSAYVKQRLATVSNRGEPSVDKDSHGPQLPDFTRWGQVRTEKLETVRRLTANNLSASWPVVPQVTQFDEADITHLQRFIEKHAKQADKLGGKLTVTAVLMKVCGEALIKFPRFNASIDIENDQLIYKDYVHIAMAVATQRGLLVPVIRDVPHKGILELAAEIVDIAGRTRNKKVKPEELEGGTFTISNQGGIGGTAFTPIVLWPQAAILGVSRARRMPVEKEGRFVPRTILPLCVSYDHRLVDGADAARFLDWICRSLGQGLTMLL